MSIFIWTRQCCFLHLRTVSEIKATLSHSYKLTHALHFSWLDHWNSPPVWHQPKSRIHHIILTLASLHSLPVCFTIDFKIWLITFKAWVLGLAPSYTIVNIEPIWPLFAALDPCMRPFWSFQSQDSNLRVTVLLPSGPLDFWRTCLRRKGLQNQ